MTTEQLRQLIETPHEREIHGETRAVTPRLVDEVWGDGELLIGVTPIMTAPEYYVVRGDSGWKTDDQGDPNDIREHIYDIEQGIAEQYGWSDEDDEDDENEDGSGCRPWPALDVNGVSWFVIPWSEYGEEQP